MKQSTKAHLALSAVALIYGANYSIAKLAMAGGVIPPLGFIFFRVLFGVIVFWFLQAVFIKEKVAREDFPRLLLLGVFGIAINQMFFFKGLELTSPIHSSLIMLATPFLVLIFAYFLLNEMITKYKILGIILGALGAILLILKDSGVQDLTTNAMLGDLFIFINASSYGLYLVLIKPLVEKYNPITIVTWAFTMGAIFVFPICFRHAMNIQWSQFEMTNVLGFAFVIVFTTLFTYLLNAFALSRLKSSTVSAYIYLQPFIAGTISLLLGQDQLTAIIIFSGFLIFSGLYFASKKIAPN